ncbi:hypothetical protein SERLA73DRAFT_70787 [Serpula lacrymans var. lacrymans S7.3]|uniref:Uncharacterized protein n=2 Tax=Serpula lacrymans var. lacrymans TaxID=341189 RepID=F8PQQ8_SERL3|nr:uncharacterized protein SERLADRAFT_435037 [Serpula lacrymans var. lacrymans S7.9]EGO01618.1 hypothetical protein SERLA73DRAFT_70787 [Serpula lacrymans var. lacrymans S7.3]EGO27272.1 hypothetical protein SERLADRAFT_435037 [Serpula lacrymans var. lacrymans S7.9]
MAPQQPSKKSCARPDIALFVRQLPEIRQCETSVHRKVLATARANMAFSQVYLHRRHQSKVNLRTSPPFFISDKALYGHTDIMASRHHGHERHLLCSYNVNLPRKLNVRCSSSRATVTDGAAPRTAQGIDGLLDFFQTY